MLILKDKETIFLTIVNDKVEVSRTLPKKGVTFEIETLSNLEYIDALMIASKVSEAISKEVILETLEFVIDKVKAVHNTKLKKTNFTFDIYFPLLNYILQESTLSDEEKDFLA